MGTDTLCAWHSRKTSKFQYLERREPCAPYDRLRQPYWSFAAGYDRILTVPRRIGVQNPRNGNAATPSELRCCAKEVVQLMQLSRPMSLSMVFDGDSMLSSNFIYLRAHWQAKRRHNRVEFGLRKLRRSVTAKSFMRARKCSAHFQMMRPCTEGKVVAQLCGTADKLMIAMRFQLRAAVDVSLT